MHNEERWITALGVNSQTTHQLGLKWLVMTRDEPRRLLWFSHLDGPLLQWGISNAAFRFNGWFPLLCSSPGVATLLTDCSIQNSWEETEASGLYTRPEREKKLHVWFTHWTVQLEEQAKHGVTTDFKKGSCGVTRALGWAGSVPGWHRKWWMDGRGVEEVKTPGAGDGTDKGLFSQGVNV